MPGPEATIERKFRDYVEGLGGLCIKLQGIRGIPDRLVMFKLADRDGGGMYFVEFKSPRGKLTKAQQHWRDRLTSMGIVVMVFRSYEEACEFHFRAMHPKPQEIDRANNHIRPAGTRPASQLGVGAHRTPALQRVGEPKAGAARASDRAVHDQSPDGDPPTQEGA